MAINTIEGMIDFCKLMTGMPIINLEVTDDQIRQVILDSADYFRRYMYGEGSYLDYSVVQLPANRDIVPITELYDIIKKEYLNNFLDVYDFQVSYGQSMGVNTLFSPTHVLLYQNFQSKQNGLYSSFGNDNSLTLSNYAISMQYLKIIQEMFYKSYTIKYLAGQDAIKITPTPDIDVVGVLQFYRSQELENILNNVHYKRLVLGKVKQLWAGLILGKYSSNLPDNTTINYQFIYDQGVRDEEIATAAILSEGMPIDPMIG